MTAFLLVLDTFPAKAASRNFPSPSSAGQLTLKMEYLVLLPSSWHAEIPSELL